MTAQVNSTTVRVLEADDPAWEDWLGMATRDIYHTAGYHDLARSSGEGTPKLVVVGNRRRGLAWPYLLRPVSDLEELADCDATDVTSVYGYPGPLAWGCRPGDMFVTQAWREIVNVWCEQGAVAAFTRFHPLLGNASLFSGPLRATDGPLAGEGLIAIGPTVSIDCTLSDDVAMAHYARALRQHIAAGRRAGLVTVEDEDWVHLDAFVALYGETMARNRAAAGYLFDRAYFDRLVAALAGHVHLLTTMLESLPVAAGLFTEFDGIVQAHLVGTSTEHRHLSPFKLLLDDTRRWARERGDRVLHIGGGRGGREDTLLSFKEEFSPRRHVFHIGRWVLDAGSYAELVRARLRVVPQPTSLDAGFFPAYRTPACDGMVAHGCPASSRSAAGDPHLQATIAANVSAT